MKRLLVLALAITACAPATASADRLTTEHPFTNVAPASYVYADAMLRSAAASADAWWLRISGRTPPPLELYVYDQDDAAAAYGSYITGEVYMSREYRNEWWRVYTDVRRALSERRDALTRAWAIIAHERGHNLGLRHEPFGIMQVLSPPAPGAAQDWARQMLPAKRSPSSRPHPCPRPAGVRCRTAPR